MVVQCLEYLLADVGTRGGGFDCKCLCGPPRSLIGGQSPSYGLRRTSCSNRATGSWEAHALQGGAEEAGGTK